MSIWDNFIGASVVFKIKTAPTNSVFWEKEKTFPLLFIKHKTNPQFTLGVSAGIQQGIGEVICHYLSTLRFIATGLLLDTRLRKPLPQDLKDFFHLHILDSEQHHCMVQQISHLRSRARLVLILQQCLNQFTCFFTGKYAKGAINKQILTQRQMNEACNYAKSSLFFFFCHTGCLVSWGKWKKNTVTMLRVISCIAPATADLWYQI